MFSSSGGGSEGGGTSVSSSNFASAGPAPQHSMNGATTIYPPQPYGPQQKMDNSNNASTSATGPTRKRGPSTSPGALPGDGKEKKGRPTEQQGGSTSIANVRSASSTNGAPAPEGRQWGEEANKLDVYVWDYLTRRGFHRAAKSLLNEAGLTGTPDVPLKTPQGLLFEYWGVFWDVFAARSGRGSADATTYYDMQEQKLANRINETARRSEAMEASFAVPTVQNRFPQVLVNNQQGGAIHTLNAQMPSVVRPLNGQTPPQVPQPAQAQQPQQVQSLQQTLGRPQTMPQQSSQSPAPATTPQPQSNAQQQQQQNQQLLLLAAQRHNIPVEELDKLNPQMRAALIQSVAANANQNASMLSGMRPGPGPLAGNASPAAPGVDAATFQRMQQQQQQAALQRQMQRGNQQQPLRPGMMGVMQGQQNMGPGTPGLEGQSTTPDGRRFGGPQQGPGMAPGQQQGNTMPHQQQTHPQGQPFNAQGAQRPAPVRPAGLAEGQAAPRLSAEQHQVLLNQYAALQQTLRQEIFQIDNAPNLEVKQRATHSAQQTQMRLTQLGSILKAQPGVQAQLAAQQQRPMQPRPPQQAQQQQPTGGQMPQQFHNATQGGAAGPFRPGFTPQQQQQIAYAQQQQRMGQTPGTPQQGNRSAVGLGGNDPSVMASTMGTANGAMANGQPQMQQSPQQMGDTQQQRSQFSFANPFAAGAGQVGTPGSISSMRRPSASQDANEPAFQQPYPAAQTPRPVMPQRVMSGMGPPGTSHISSPSPRMAQGPLSQQDGSIAGSPATIPSTPRASGTASGNGAPSSAAGADKKKKEARGRKNSKAVSAANKTPVLGAASTSGTMGTPAPQAPTPASASFPTPGHEQGPQSQGLPRPAGNEQAQQHAPHQNMVSNPASSSVFGTPMSSVANVGQPSFPNMNTDGTAPMNSSGIASGTSASADGQGNAANAANADDLSQMFGGNNDMSQFLDFEFNSGNNTFGGDSGGGDTWDSSNLNALFGDSLS